MPILLIESIPDTRRLVLGRKSTLFSYPKDPADMAWFAITFGEPLASIDTYPITGADTNLAVGASTLTPDKNEVALYLTHGNNGVLYTFKLGVTTLGGDVLFRSASLLVQNL